LIWLFERDLTNLKGVFKILAVLLKVFLKGKCPLDKLEKEYYFLSWFFERCFLTESNFWLYLIKAL